MYLIKFQSDYADEFEVYGFKVVESLEGFEEELNKAKQFWQRYRNAKVSMSFGTNEELVYEGYDAYASCFEISIITEEEMACLERLFDGEWGFVDAFNFVEHVAKTWQTSSGL